MPILNNIGLLATCRDSGPQSEIHSERDAALVWEDDKIIWCGPQSKLPAKFAAMEKIDAAGRLVIPGLVDCHTHLAFAGWRADEFEKRILGETYQEIAAAGGGIRATVRKTREASEEQLLERCCGFLDKMLRLGITTVECKSGYGLDVANELKLLRVYQRLAALDRATIVPTFLGAHVVPAEHKKDRERYIELLTQEMIPRIAEKKLAVFCDVFLEEGAFSYSEADEILACGVQFGLIPKIHADQLSCRHGAELAAEMNAASADHLEHISKAGVRAMAEKGVVAVILPFASLYTSQHPTRGRDLVDAGVKVAVATDFNPGTAPMFNLPMALLLACTMSKLTPNEALKAATVNAARAIRMENRVGSLEAGKQADFAVIDAPDATHWLYHLEPDSCCMTVRAGKVVWRRPATPTAGDAC